MDKKLSPEEELDNLLGAPVASKDKPSDPEAELNQLLGEPIKSPEATIPQAPSVAPEDVREDDPNSAFMGVPGGRQSDIAATKEKEKQDRIKKYGTEDFSQSMYADKSPEEAKKLYESVKTKADGSTLFGEPTIGNEIIPNPTHMPSTLDRIMHPFSAENTYGGPAETGELLANSTRLAVKGTATSGAAMLDEAYEKLTGTNPQLTKSVQDYISDPAPSTTLKDQAITEIGRVGIGSLAAVAVTRKLMPEEAIGVMSKIATSTAAVLGDVLTASTDAQNMIVGKDSAISDLTNGTFLEGIPVNENGQLSHQVLQKKMNYLYDQLVVGLGVKTGINTAEVGIKFIKGITWDALKPLWSENARVTEVTRNIVHNLNVPPTKENALLLRDYIQENKDVILDATNIVDGEEQITLKRSSLSAVSEGLLKDGDVNKASEVMASEKGFLQGNELLDNTIKQPRVEGGRVVDKLASGLNENDAIGQTKRVLVDSAKSTLDNAANAEMDVATKNDLAKNLLTQRLENDPLVGDKIKQMANKSGLEINTTGEKLYDDIQSAASKLEETNRANWDELPKGIPMDKKSFDTVSKAHLKNLPESVKTFMKDNKANIMDYKFARTELLPEIQKALNAEYRSAGGQTTKTMDALYAFRKEITENQEKYLPSSVKGIVDKARSFWKENIFPFNNEKSPLVGFWDTNSKFNSGKLSSIPSDRQYGLMNETAQIANTFSDAQPGTSKAVVDLLSTTGNKDSLFDYQFGKNLEKSLPDLMKGDLDKLDAPTLMRNMGVNESELAKNFPDKVQQFNTLVTDLKAAKGDVDKTAEILARVQEVNKQIEEGVYKSALGKFIKKGVNGPQEVDNPYQVMKDMFDDEQQVSNVKELVSRINASGDDLAKKGLQASYMNYLNDTIFSSKKGQADEAMKRFQDTDLSSLYKYGDLIFDTPESKKILDLSKSMIDTITEEDAKRAGVATTRPMGNTPRRVFTNAQLGANRIITGAFGVLNPMATKVRIVVAGLTGKSEALAKMTRIQQAILSDPDEAIKALEQFAKDVPTESIGKKAIRNQLLMKLGVYEPVEKASGNKKETETINEKMKVPQGVK